MLPKYQELSRLNLEIKHKKTEFQYIEEHFSEIHKLLEELENYKDKLEKVNFAFPSDDSLTLVSLLRFLVNTSSQTGLIFKELNSYSISVPKTTSGKVSDSGDSLSSRIKTISLSFEVSGSYSAFKNFLKTLERSAKIIEVEKTSFSFEEEGIFSFAVQIKTYLY